MPDTSHTTAGAEESPVSRIAEADYGAETLQLYAYQAGYAIVLLAAAAAKKIDLVSVWCEQHDDILGQTAEGLFDSYQVKTRKPEAGEWVTTDDEFVKSIKTFATLEARFPNKFRRFHFISNNRCSDAAGKEQWRAPKRLHSNVEELLDPSLADPVTRMGLQRLAQDTRKTEQEVLRVLRKLSIVPGPSRDGFEAELAQTHLAQLPWCQLPQPQLKALVETLLQMALRAGRRASQDPARHYTCLDAAQNPHLLEKKITVDSFIAKTRELARAPFRYLISSATHPVKRDPENEAHFDKKLRRGGLGDESIEILRAKMLATEQRLLELIAKTPPEAEGMTAQIEMVVRDECERARLQAASQGQAAYGTQMLNTLYERLEAVAKQESERVYRQPAEVLHGMAGLLTENCTVWWSDKFNLEEE